MRALLVVALALALAPAARADLRVHVSDKPFALRVVDARDGDVLRSVHGASGARLVTRACR